MTESTIIELAPDEPCGQGWLDGKEGRSGRWILDADRYFGPDCALARVATEGLSAIDPIIQANAGKSLADYIACLTESDECFKRPEAFIFMPIELPLLSYAMRVRPDLMIYACATYSEPGRPSTAAGVPGLGALVIFDMDGFSSIADDDGLISEAKRCVRGVDRSATWLCLAAAPSDDWIAVHASSDVDEFHALCDERDSACDWRWEGSYGGMILKELAEGYFQADRRWLYTSPSSFAWWPGPLRVDVIVHACRSDRTERRLFVTATIGIVQGAAADERELAVALTEINRRASGVFSAYWDKDEQVLRFFISSWIDPRRGYKGLSSFAKRTLIMAREAHDLIDTARSLCKADTVDSSLFYSRSRRDIDPALGFLEKVCAPTNTRRIPWLDEHDVKQTQDLLLSNSFVLVRFTNTQAFEATHHDLHGLRITYAPIHESKAGSGLELQVVRNAPGGLASVSLEAFWLNQDSATIRHGLDLHGAWLAMPSLGLYRLVYRSFLPSPLYQKGSLLAETKMLLDLIGYWSLYCDLRCS